MLALAASEPCHEPGATHGYHAWTYGWLVGEIAQRVTGRRFSELLASELVFEAPSLVEAKP